MASQPLVQGPLFGAPVSRLDFTRREFVKTPSPSPESSPEKEEATPVDVHLAALEIHGEPCKMVVKTAAGDKAKRAAAATGSDAVSPVGARDKEGAISGKYTPFDFFDVLDMLEEEGIGIDDGGDLTGGQPNAKSKAAVVKKHPVGCRQRNVARRMVCPSLERGDFDNPILSKNRAVLKEMVEKDQAQRERERLDYLKNAR